MNQMKLRNLLLYPACLGLALFFLFGAGVCQTKDGEIRRPLKTAPPASAPEDDRLFVWSLPEETDQSVFVLKVLDDDTVDVALLHPVRAKLKGAGKGKTVAALEKELTGRLLHARFLARDQEHRPVLQLWLGKEQGWLHDTKDRK